MAFSMASAVGSTMECSDAELPEEVRGKVPRLAVAVAGEDDVALRFHEGHDRQQHRCHAGGVEHRALGPFDGGELAFGLLLGRVAVAGVLVLADHLALALGAHEILDLVGRVEVVIGGLHDRRGDRMVGLGKPAQCRGSRAWRVSSSLRSDGFLDILFSPLLQCVA